MNTALRFTLLLAIPFAWESAICQPNQQPSVDGGAIFMQRCAKCHGDKGQGITSAITIAGPDIRAVHDAGDVMAAMEMGPSHMPSFAAVLSVDQMHAVAKYVTGTIASMPLKGGDIGDGGKLFRTNCAPCHRTAVRGGALAFTGINAPALTDKSAAIIAGTIRLGPGPMPAFPPSVLTDQQVASIVKYIQFVQHPPSPGGTPLNWYGPVAEGFMAWITLAAVVGLTGWIEKGGKG